METNSVVPVPAPVAPPPLPSEALAKEGAPPPRPKKFPFLLLLPLLAVFAAAVYFGFRYLPKKSGEAGALPDFSRWAGIITSSPTPTATPAKFAPIQNGAKLLAYLHNAGTADSASLEIHLVDPATGKDQALPIKGVLSAYKYYGSPLLFYVPESDNGTVRLLNLETGTEDSYTPITHPDPKANETATIQNLYEVSPDGKYFVFMAGFFTVCPSPSPFPSGFEGGFGPCGPDESLDTPSGYYLFDVAAKKSTYLGSFIRVERWDLPSHKLYYADMEPGKNSLALDLTAHTKTYYDSTQYFGYYAFPLFQTDRLVKFEGSTGTTNESQFDRITLVDRAANKTLATIDSSDSWATLQPFFAISPDEKNLIFIRTVLPGDGIRRFGLYRYNFADGKATRLSPDDDSLTFSPFGDWLDSNTFVTTVTKVGDNRQYSRQKNDLVKFNLETGEMTRLTEGEPVFIFNEQ